MHTTTLTQSEITLALKRAAIHGFDPMNSHAAQAPRVMAALTRAVVRERAREAAEIEAREAAEKVAREAAGEALAA